MGLTCEVQVRDSLVGVAHFAADGNENQTSADLLVAVFPCHTRWACFWPGLFMWTMYRSHRSLSLRLVIRKSTV